HSAKTNSYYQHPLGTMLTKQDDFSLAFDLRLNDLIAGIDTNKSSAFQISVGLLNLASATRTNFFRGSGVDATNGPVNLVEFDYFPDDPVYHYGATISPTMLSATNQFSDGGFSFPFELTIGDLYHVEMNYTAANRTLATVMTRNGQPFGPINDATLGATFTDFHVDQLAIASYSDAGQDPQYGGSVLAHGILDNFSITTPPPPVANIAGGFTGNSWQVQFSSQTNWLYTLERTGDFQTWAAASTSLTGTGGSLSLSDTNAAAGKAFYRVRAERP
ncbi:MAG: hypothetical protein JWR69_670, partial [Pedosphaera sp.]|nr:hypothetical protein [Pedosphaera sp.]